MDAADAREAVDRWVRERACPWTVELADGRRVDLRVRRGRLRVEPDAAKE